MKSFKLSGDHLEQNRQYVWSFITQNLLSFKSVVIKINNIVRLFISKECVVT